MARLTHVGTYRRTVRASVQRIWENALDWEHLPWLHRSSFQSITLLERGPQFWRARVELSAVLGARSHVLELRTDRPRLTYVTRTIEGSGAGTEIRTRLDPAGEHSTRIEVEFHQAGAARLLGPVLGAAYERLYARLWQEDEAMMVHRQAVLDAAARRRAAASSAAKAAISLGDEDQLRRRLPLVVATPSGAVRIIDVAGELVAHSTVCPHLGGPLDGAPVEDGTITCPWHGYRFDARTGAPVGDHRCRLDPAPRIELDPACRAVRLTWEGANPTV